MLKEVVLAIVQAATEFLPVSSSGHLALFGTYFNDVNLMYISLLHLASAIAIIIYLRKEIWELRRVKDEDVRNLWMYLIVGIIPAGIVGVLFHSAIEAAFNTPLVIGIGFVFTGNMLITCYNFQHTDGSLNKKSSLLIGLSQIIALFPGVSRSGTTISFGIFTGLDRDEAFRFSFLMAIPLIIGAAILSFQASALTLPMILGFFICIVLSYGALWLLEFVLKKKFFWLFGVYCLTIGVIILYMTF